jgi:hypothetical protein
MLALRLGKSLSERILPMPKRPFLSPFLATEVAEAEAEDEVEDEAAGAVDGPTHNSSTLCTYFLCTSNPQSIEEKP